MVKAAEEELTTLFFLLLNLIVLLAFAKLWPIWPILPILLIFFFSGFFFSLRLIQRLIRATTYQLRRLVAAIIIVTAFA